MYIYMYRCVCEHLPVLLNALTIAVPSMAGSSGGRKSRLPEGGEESTAKSRKSSQPTVICSACRSRASGPGSVAWAAESGGRPVGDQCSKCKALWSTAFPYMDWPQFAKVSMAEEC